MKLAERILDKTKSITEGKDLEVSVSVAKEVGEYIKDQGFSVKQPSSNVWSFKDGDEKKEASNWIVKKFGKEEIISEELDEGLSGAEIEAVLKKANAATILDMLADALEDENKKLSDFLSKASEKAAKLEK